MGSMVTFSQRYRFSDWPNKAIPKVSAGVYTIWNEDDLFYCGMSGRDIEGAIACQTAPKTFHLSASKTFQSSDLFQHCFDDQPNGVCEFRQ